MKFKTLTLTEGNSIATIEFNRPESLNAVNEQLVWDFQEATSSVRNNDSIKILVIQGEGRAFCAGADLSEKNSSWEGSQDALIRGYKPFFENIIEMSKPVIASINGPAAGVGASIAMACDLRIMSKDAYILSVFSNIALVPDGGLSWMLTRFLGYAKAYEYAIEAKKIDSEVCLKYGIANKVVEKNNLKEETLKWANELIKRPSQSLSLTKKLMRESFNNSFWEIYAKEAEIQNNLTKSEQNHEAVKAFFEKRKPNFD